MGLAENAKHGEFSPPPPAVLSEREGEGSDQPYVEFEVIEPAWGEDTDLLEEWFAQGDHLDYSRIDWIYWVDLYRERVDRSDLVVHWLRCLFDRTLPRPPALGAA